MKQKLLLTALSLCSAAAIAQPLANHAHGHQPFSATFGAARMAANHTAAKTTSPNASRCIAEVDYNSPANVFVVEDSSTYSYSGTGGSYITGWPWRWDNSLEYSYSSGTYTNSQKGTQTFDANNNIISRVSQNWDVPLSSWVNADNQLFTYDAMNRQLTYIEQSWDGTAWQNSYKQTYTYTGSSIYQTTETGQTWNSATSAWDNEDLYTYTYDASNNPTLILEQQWNSATSVWDNYTQETDTYDAMNNFTGGTKQTWNTSTNAWDNYYRYTLSGYIAPYCPQLEVDQVWDAATSAYVNAQEYLYTYNSYNQITYEYTQSWDTAGSGSWYTSVNEFATRLYYEDYTSAVQNVSNTGGTAVVYPVPATNTLSLAISWDASQPFAISMYDMQGRMLQQLQVPATNSYTGNIPVNDLPAGNYLIKIEGRKGTITKPVTITK